VIVDSYYQVGEFKEEILQLAALASQGEVYSVVVVIWKQFGGTNFSASYMFYSHTAACLILNVLFI
jgi:hypothetical protein